MLREAGRDILYLALILHGTGTQVPYNMTRKNTSPRVGLMTLEGKVRVRKPCSLRPRHTPLSPDDSVGEDEWKPDV